MQRLSPVVVLVALAGCFPGLERDPSDNGASPPSAADENGGGVTDGGPGSEGGPGGCVDVASDAKNCGACGHDCLGAACNGGLCVPQALGSQSMRDPRAVVSAGGKVFYSALDDDNGVADYKGPVREIGADGTSGRTLEDASGVKSMFATSTHVVWRTWASPSGTVRGCALPGCSPITLATDTSWDNGVVVVGSKVFFASGFEIQSCGLGPGATPTTAVPNAAPRGLATDGTSLFWLNEYAANGGRGVRKCAPPSCSAPITIVPVAEGVDLGPTGSDATTTIAAGSGNVFWIQGAEIWTATTNGGAPHAFVPAAPYVRPAAIAMDATTVYWTAQHTIVEDGRVLACAITGCSKPRVLADKQYDPAGLTVDGTHVYWMTTEDAKGALWKVAK
jgi:hypothetical protein